MKRPAACQPNQPKPKKQAQKKCEKYEPPTPWEDGHEWDDRWYWQEDVGWVFDYQAWREGDVARQELETYANQTAHETGMASEGQAKEKKKRESKATAKRADQSAASAETPRAKPEDRKRKIKPEDSEREPKEPNKPAKRANKKEAKEEKYDPVPTTPKEQRKEMRSFLESVKAKDLNEDNARSVLRSMVPAFKTGECALNVYWVRRGIKGVGVGVTSRSEGNDFAFFGFRSISDDWILCIATALKAADMLVANMHWKYLLQHVSLSISSWFGVWELPR